uniref:Uncharacterized protein n=1 Tax=viral metagenome TaxID=1070528 RepID=A0A6H1ZH84_9ZZZZ
MSNISLKPCIDDDPEKHEEDYLQSLIGEYERDYDRFYVENEWHRQLQIPLPMHLLYDRWHYILRVDQPYHEPDAGFVRKLKDISNDLSVHWIGRDQRWGLFISHRVVYDVYHDGVFYRVCDYFPMCTQILKGPKGEYMPLDERSLPEINFNKLDIFGYMVMMDNAYEENVIRHKKNMDQMFYDNHRENRRELEVVTSKVLGYAPNIAVPVGIDLKQ